MMKRMAGCLCLIVFTLFFHSCDDRRAVQVERRGDEVVIHSGKDTLTARTIGGKRSTTYLLVGGSGRGLFPFIAHFSVIPMAKVERFEREYGDFLKCKSSGALEVEGNVGSMFLYASNENVAEVLHETDNFAMLWKHPIMKMTFVEIKIVKHTAKILGKEVKVESNFRPNFLVTHAELIHSNYP